MRYIFLICLLASVCLGKLRTFEEIVSEARQAIKVRTELIQGINKVKETRQSIGIIVSMSDRRIGVLNRYLAFVAAQLGGNSNTPDPIEYDISGIAESFFKAAIDDLTEQMYMGSDDAACYMFLRTV